MTADDVAVVMVTRNRREQALRSLQRLHALAGAGAIVVVDNASEDGTAAAIVDAFPATDVVRLSENRGAAGRSVGVARVTQPIVAFADDDSWWTAGALDRLAAAFSDDARLGLAAGRVEIGERGFPDPTSLAMACAPIGRPRGWPGPAVLGFVACGAAVRREAYLQVGGFDVRFGVGGEESLLAIDLMTAGWHCAYIGDAVARHEPSTSRDADRRRRTDVRNGLWTSWWRDPVPAALRLSAAVARSAVRDPAARRGLIDAMRGLRGLRSDRRPIPPDVALRRAGLRTAERRRQSA